jgi:hypothetical protein
MLLDRFTDRDAECLYALRAARLRVAECRYKKRMALLAARFSPAIRANTGRLKFQTNAKQIRVRSLERSQLLFGK